MGSNDHMDLPGHDLDEPPTVEQGETGSITAAEIHDMVAAIEPHYPAHLSILRLEPGDRLVFRLKGELTQPINDAIGNLVATQFPNHKPAIILDNGCELGVVRPAKGGVTSDFPGDLAAVPEPPIDRPDVNPCDGHRPKPDDEVEEVDEASSVLPPPPPNRPHTMS